MTEIYGLDARGIDGAPVKLADFRGKVLLIVNTASKCGFTPQYAGLEALQNKYAAQGFSVLGFPCNQFGAQEPGDESEIANFCKLTYDVDFPMFAKIDVNGPGTAPLFDALKAAAPGVMGTKSIKWNFTKFLVSRDGSKIERFAPNVTPSALERKIESLL